MSREYSKICLQCVHFKDTSVTQDGYYTCQKAGYDHDNGGYGPRRLGANCIHDQLLSNHFEPLNGEEFRKSKDSMEHRISDQNKEIDRLRNENNKLRSLIAR